MVLLHLICIIENNPLHGLDVKIIIEFSASEIIATAMKYRQLQTVLKFRCITN